MITLKSQPTPVTNYTDVFDEEMVAKSISYRKAKFDQGVNAVQSKINQLSSIPTLTDEDAQYLNSKIGNLTNTINSNQGIDFSDSMNLSKIDSDALDISSDNTILNAASSAKNHQKEMKFMDDAKNNPKKYGDILSPHNDRDYSDHLRDYKLKRQNGEEAVFSYQYKPFVDIQGELLKRVEKLKATATSEINGNYIINGKELTPQRIRAEAFSQLQTSPKMMGQLAINSKYDTENISDADLITSKNHLLQIQELKYRKDSESELARLLTLDVKDPNRTAVRIAEATEVFQKHEKSYNKYKNSPTYIGEGAYNRQKLAQELTLNNILTGLDQFAISERKITPNMIPLAIAKQDFLQKMARLTEDRKEREFNYTKDRDKIDDQFRNLELASKNGTKTKIAEGELDGSTSIDIPNIKDVDNAQNNFQVMRDDAVKETRKLLIDEYKNRIGVIGKLDDAFLSNYVDKLVRANGTSANLDEEKTTKMLKGKLAEYGNAQIPEDAVIKNMLRSLNKLSIDVKKVFDTGELLSTENSQFLSKYLKGVQKNTVMNSIPQSALENALSVNGISPKEYEYLKGKNFGTSKDPNRRSLFTSDQYSKEKMAFDNVQKSIDQFYKDKASTAQLFPSQTYTEKYRKESGVDVTLNNVLGQGRLSMDGTTNIGNGVYGKENEKATNRGTRVEAVDYNYATQVARVKVFGINTLGKEFEQQGVQSFSVPREYMENHTSEKVKKGSQTLTQSELLHLAGGEIYRQTKSGKSPMFDQLPNRMATPFRAVLVDKNDVSNNKVNIFIKLPVNGRLTTFELPGAYDSVEYAERDLTQKTLQLYEDLKNQGRPKKDIPNLVAKAIIDSLTK